MRRFAQLKRLMTNKVIRASAEIILFELWLRITNGGTFFGDHDFLKHCDTKDLFFAEVSYEGPRYRDLIQK